MNWADVIRMCQKNMSVDRQEVCLSADERKSTGKKTALEISANKFVSVLCETEDIPKVLKEIFQIDMSEELQGKGYHYYNVMRGYVAKYEEKGEEVHYYTTHWFPSRIFPFLITDRIDPKRVMRSFELFWLRKEMNPYERMLIRDKCKVTKCDITELKDKLCHVKYQYDLEPLTEALSLQNHRGIAILADSYVKDMGADISIRLVSAICNSLDSDIWTLMAQCKNCIIGNFMEKLSGILEQYFLKENDFINNFVCTAVYMDEIEKSKEEIEAYCDNKIMPVVERIQEKARETEKLETELFNLVAGEDVIANIDTELLNGIMSRVASRMEVIYIENE